MSAGWIIVMVIAANLAVGVLIGVGYIVVSRLSRNHIVIHRSKGD